MDILFVGSGLLLPVILVVVGCGGVIAKGFRCVVLVLVLRVSCVVRICSYCGSRARDSARFCKYCGRPLTGEPGRAGEKPGYPSAPAPKAEVAGTGGPSGAGGAGEVREVPGEVLEQLEWRVELRELEEEKREVAKELEGLEGELERGERPVAELEKMIAPLKKRIKAITAREKKLESKVKPFSFEEAGKARRLWSERLEKLEELKKEGKVRESVYRRLREEYESKRREADVRYREELSKAREWLALLKSRYAAARDDLATLEARHAVGEIGEGEFQSRREELEKQASRLGSQVEILESIIRGL